MGSEDGQVSLVEVTENDAEAFAHFFRRAWEEAGPEAAGFTGASDEAIAELTSPQAFRERIGGPDRRIFLARENDLVLGFASTRRISEDAVELSGIIVLPSHGGLGVGTALLECATAAAIADGYRTILVKTETTNSRAQAFYENGGLLLTVRRPSGSMMPTSRCCGCRESSESRGEAHQPSPASNNDSSMMSTLSGVGLMAMRRPSAEHVRQDH